MTRGAGRKDRHTGTFGSVDKLATGYRARYFGPDGRRHKAPTLFLTKREARAWLSLRHAEIVRKAWEPPEAGEQKTAAITFADYSEQWIAQRDLKDRTREHYGQLLAHHLVPAFGGLPLTSITPDDVRAWHAKMGERGTPTLRAHCYGLLRTIFNTAASDGKIGVSPCVIRGAASARRVHKIQPATLGELAAIVEAMPEQLRPMILLASWCAMRYGEIAELRRMDIDLRDEVIRVRRGVVRVNGGKFKVTTPKSDAGVRDVAIPPHLLPALEDHLSKHVAKQRDSLIFPAQGGQHLAPATLNRHWYKARDAANRSDLRFHDLRHSGAVLAAATGATLAELMARLGHSTPAAAMRYQHAAQGRDRQIAALLSKIAVGGS